MSVPDLASVLPDVRGRRAVLGRLARQLGDPLRAGRAVGVLAMLDAVQLELAADGLQVADHRAQPRVVRRLGELRNHDRRQDAQNDDHDKDFDESKGFALHECCLQNPRRSGLV